MPEKPSENTFGRFGDLFQRIAAWKEALVAAVAAMGALYKFLPLPSIVLLGAAVFLAAFFLLKAARQGVPLHESSNGAAEEFSTKFAAVLEQSISAETVDSDRLSIFVKSWMFSAWDKAVVVLISMRSEIGRQKGQVIEGLFQEAVLQKAGNIRGGIEDRLGGRSAKPLLMLAAEGVNEYEELIAQMWFCGGLVNQPLADSRSFQEWKTQDDKMLDHLRELVAWPEFSNTPVEYSYKVIDEGDTRSKAIRRNLASRPTSGRDGGVA